MPVLLATATFVRLTSRGAAIYRQIRLGRNGQQFTMYKIRTMTDKCEAATGARWASHNDSRVVPLGSFLRHCHLDELPQLWNVVVGDMSLVGPRPERPEFLAWLEQSVPGYRDRLRVLPGITGLAQIQLPPDSDLDSVRRKLALDLHYIRNCSTSLDLRILMCTAFHVTGIADEWVQTLCGLPALDQQAITTFAKINELLTSATCLPKPLVILGTEAMRPREMRPALGRVERRLTLSHSG
jgi:lipopolysaccharide/colanic/teichoic acid biosynthesis glycosyltransferase